MELGKLVQELDPNTIPSLGEDAIYFFAIRELSMVDFMAVLRNMALATSHPRAYMKGLHDKCPWIADTVRLEANKSVYWKYKSDRGRLDEGVAWDQSTIDKADKYIANHFKES